jgi:hypothetical protein
VACYGTQTQRQIAIAGAHPEDRAQYEAGRVVGSATRYYPTGRGGVRIIASPYASASESSATGSNEWHTVGMLCHGDTIWLHDPAYALLRDVTQPQRLPLVPGTSNVTRLLDSSGFGTVSNCYIQGPSAPTTNSMPCMGQRAQWVDKQTCTKAFEPPKDAIMR